MHATPPLVPPPPPAARVPPSSRQSAQPTPPSSQPPNEPHRERHEQHQHRESSTDTRHVAEHTTNTHHEVKRSTEFELRHAEGSSIPVHSSLRGSLPLPAHSGASPARKPISVQTAAIIAAHSRPPAGHPREFPQGQSHPQASSNVTPGNFSRLLSSVTSLQSQVSASSASLQGLAAENVSVLAGPKPSYANPTQAYTSRQRSPSVRARDTDIHPPSSSGDINAASRKRSGPAAPSSSQHTASPPRRPSGPRSAHNTHSSERAKPAAATTSVQDSQRTVEWARSGEHKSSRNSRSSSGGKKSTFVYPESLSPGRTLELVHELVGRSLTHEHQHNQEQEQLQERPHEPQRERQSHHHSDQRKHRDRESGSHRVPHDADKVRSSI